MKKIYALFLLLISLSSSKAQLAGTGWIFYDPSNAPFSYFEFNADGILYNGIDPTSVTPLSNYGTNGDTLAIADLPGGVCLSSDTGLYLYNISNDTLTFTLISDDCSDRAIVLGGGYYGILQSSTSISKPIEKPLQMISANPSANGVYQFNANNAFTATVFDLKGNIIKASTNYSSGNITIDLSAQPSGIYILKTSNNWLTGSFKLVK